MKTWLGLRNLVLRLLLWLLTWGLSSSPRGLHTKWLSSRKWWEKDVCARMNEWASELETRQNRNQFCVTWSRKWHTINFVHILLVTWTNPATVWDGISKRCEYQDLRILEIVCHTLPSGPQWFITFAHSNYNHPLPRPPQASSHYSISS